MNIAAGPSFNIFTGWRQIDNSEVEITDINEKPRLGYQIKIGKSFEPVENFIIEPEARILSLKYLDINTHVMSFGIGVGCKYRL